jgi:tight adherence protein C
MTTEFLIALMFGFGVAGLTFNLKAAPASSLHLRIRVPVAMAQPISSNQLNPIQNLLTRVRSLNNSRIEKALFELPEIIDLLAVCLKAGDGIYQAFEKVVPRSTGALARELDKIMTAVQYGAAFSEEIKKLPNAIPHPQFQEFASKVSLAINRGSPLAQMLKDQGESARSEIRNLLIRQAGRNETRMLFPLVFLILPVTVLFAIYPSLKLLNFAII